MEYTSSAINYSSEVPVNSISDASTIMFTMPPTDDFIDLQESYMVVKVKALKANGAALVETNKVALSNNVVGSLFKAVSVYLNGVKVAQSNVYQAIENYFATRFGSAKDATNIYV